MASEWRMKINLRVKKYLNVANFLSSRMTAFALPGLHDARSGAGDDHEAGLHNLAPEIHGLLIFHLARLRPGRAENGDLADVRIRREEAEGITQFAQRGLDHPHVAGLLHVGEQLERVFDDVGDLVFVVAAAFEGDEFLDAAL